MMIRIDKSLYRHGSFALAIDLRIRARRTSMAIGMDGDGCG